MQTPFEMAWLILKQGKVGRIGPDSLMSHRHAKPPINPTKGSAQYKERGMLDRAYAGRGTPPSPPRDTSLDEFTDELELDTTPTDQQRYEALLDTSGRAADKYFDELFDGYPSAAGGTSPEEVTMMHLRNRLGHLGIKGDEQNISDSYNAIEPENELNPSFYQNMDLMQHYRNLAPPAPDLDQDMHEGAAHYLEDMKTVG